MSGIPIWNGIDNFPEDVAPAIPYTATGHGLLASSVNSSGNDVANEGYLEIETLQQLMSSGWPINQSDIDNATTYYQNAVNIKMNYAAQTQGPTGEIGTNNLSGNLFDDLIKMVGIRAQQGSNIASNFGTIASNPITWIVIAGIIILVIIKK